MRVRPTSVDRCPESVSCGKSVRRIYGARIRAMTAKRGEDRESDKDRVDIILLFGARPAGKLGNKDIHRDERSRRNEEDVGDAECRIVDVELGPCTEGMGKSRSRTSPKSEERMAHPARTYTAASRPRTSDERESEPRPALMMACRYCATPRGHFPSCDLRIYGPRSFGSRGPRTDLC